MQRCSCTQLDDGTEEARVRRPRDPGDHLPVEPAEAWSVARPSPTPLGRWLDAEVELDVRPAGRGCFRFADGETRFAVVETRRRRPALEFRWWPPASDDASRVAIELEPVAGGSRVRVTGNASASRHGHVAPPSCWPRMSDHARQRHRDRRRLSALADPTRRVLVDRLADRPATGDRARARRRPVSRQAVVKHLQALDAAGLVEAAATARVRYRLHRGSARRRGRLDDPRREPMGASARSSPRAGRAGVRA